MRKSLRRFEMLLPLQFNDGRRVPAETNRLTLNELRERFGGVSAETQTIHEEWSHRGRIYRDKSSRIFVDAPDDPAVREFFAKYKKVLMRRYRQHDIWMTSYLIETI